MGRVKVKVKPYPRVGIERKVATLTVRRIEQPDGKPFYACVRFSGTGVGSCGFGSNPRNAITKALREAAYDVRRRKGAFKGAK